MITQIRLMALKMNLNVFKKRYQKSQIKTVRFFLAQKMIPSVSQSLLSLRPQAQGMRNACRGQEGRASRIKGLAHL